MRRRRSKIDYRLIFADGEVSHADPADLFKLADVIATNYGIGSCRSFSEFVEMINNEDPVILTGLIKSIKERRDIENGTVEVNGAQEFEVPEPTPATQKKIYKAIPGNEKLAVVRLLRDMGAPKQEIDEALAKIKSGKIESPKHDFSWINGKELAKPDFPFQEVLKKMQEDYDRSAKILVSADTMIKRQQQELKASQNGK